jgi:NAD-dependent SIR2 family protein deacetylase
MCYWFPVTEYGLAWEEITVSRCQHCDGFVTEQYVRVFAPTGMNTVRVCPNCEDKLRDGAEVREAHSPRQTNNG